ncbi:hypothetical protein GCM10009547_49380 [Sporichthya brevicatena]|uniref:Uncharacterized protein n=1 Tax=Sporichthya brevicatena TaxID=171442 RepID=A0ABN1HDE1_9ACTN
MTGAAATGVGAATATTEQARASTEKRQVEGRGRGEGSNRMGMLSVSLPRDDSSLLWRKEATHPRQCRHDLWFLPDEP